METTRYAVRALRWNGQYRVPRNGAADYGAQYATRQIAEGSYDIAAENLCLSFDEVVAHLRQHTLKSTDLVRIDGCWMSISDAPPFLDVAVPFARREKRVWFLKAAGLFGLFVLLKFVIPFLIFAVGN